MNYQPLPQSHPVAELLEAVASGVTLTSGHLDGLAQYDSDLPPGQSMSRWSGPLQDAAQQINSAGKDPSRRRMQAVALSDDLASRMTTEQRRITTRTSPHDLDDAARRMFNH